MFATILAAITAFFSAIPIIGRWIDSLKKAPIDEENDAKKAVDKEMQENKVRESKRPSGDFWKDRSP